MCADAKDLIVGKTSLCKRSQALAIGVLSCLLMTAQEGVNFLVNQELLNFIKGVLGILYSSGHAGLSILHLLKDIAKLNAQSCKKDLRIIIKDLISIIACTGHAIPSWLPGLLLMMHPPAVLAIILVWVGVKLVGCPDLLGYGPTLLLLKYRIYQDNITAEDKITIQKSWDDMMKEIHPKHGIQGVFALVFAAHIIGTITGSLFKIIIAAHCGSHIAELADTVTTYAITALGFGAGARSYYRNKTSPQTAAAAERRANGAQTSCCVTQTPDPSTSEQQYDLMKYLPEDGLNKKYEEALCRYM